MRLSFFAAAMAALMLCGCGAGSTFAPSLRETPPVEHQFPWWDDSNTEETEQVEPTRYESPIRENCMEIHHSGRWRLATPDDNIQFSVSSEMSENDVAFLVNDHGWQILVVNLRGSSPVDELMAAQATAVVMVELLSVIAAPGLLRQHPEAFQNIPEDRRLEAARELVRERAGIHISELNVPEHTTDAASFSMTAGEFRIHMVGMRSDYADDQSGIIVTGIWPRTESSPIPLMDLTQIASQVRLLEDCE